MYLELKGGLMMLYIYICTLLAYWETGLEVSEDLKAYAQPDAPLSTLGFDKVYLINLKRRPDRLRKMMNSLRILGIDVDIIEATDGK
jgi:hypothetical protein